jgi:GntR family transcriptional regulator
MPRRLTLVDQVRDSLLSDLLDGRLAAGAQLPNEDEIAERYAVSRATVREAVRGLIESGYVVRRHGHGTFVTGRPRHRHALDSTVSYFAMIREVGMEPGEEVLSTRERDATPTEADLLGLATTEPLVCIERVRTADGQPAVYSQDRIPRRVLGEHADSALDASLYDRLAAAGMAVHHATAELRAVSANARVARLLHIEAGTALQLIDQVDFTVSGVAVMLSTEWHAPGVFELRVNRRPPPARKDPSDGVLERTAQRGRRLAAARKQER